MGAVIGPKAFGEVLKLRDKVKRTKREAALGVDQLRRDIERLKTNDPRGFQDRLDRMRELLSSFAPSR